jgi:hypothetical protein
LALVAATGGTRHAGSPSRSEFPLSDGLTDDRTGPERLIDGLTLASCLDFAKTHCGEEDVAILTGKLAGISAKEIARTLEISESAVDHRYRNTLGYLRQHLQSAESGGGR